MDEHVLVVRGRRRLLGLVIDRTDGDETIAEARIVPSTEGSRYLAGMVALEDGVLLIQDVDAMLTDEEERAVDESLGDAP